MGAVAYGRKLREDETSVSYTYAIDPDDPEGVLVIPMADPDTWYVEGRDTKPTTAKRILGKAVMTHRRTGTWPETVAYQA